MNDSDLLKIKRLCRDRYLLSAPVSLLARWVHSGERLDDRLTAQINVHGVGIAFKRVGGRRTHTLCVRVSVLRKMSPERLERSGGTLVPREIDGIPIDVVEAGPLVAGPLMRSELAHTGAGAADPQAVQTLRPLRPGCSIEFGNVSFGTVGAFCRSLRPRDRGRIVMLSCRHVLAGFGEPMPLAPIFQPGGPGEEPARAAVAGKATRVIEPEDPAASPLTYVADAAIAPLRPGIRFDPDNLGIGVPTGVLDLLPLSAADALTEERYCKFGRTTGLTVGMLETFKQDTRLKINDQVHLIDDTFVVRQLDDADRPISVPGDSGAMVFRQADRKAVGLLVGGPIGQDEGTAFFFSPLQPILERLHIELA